MVNKQITLGYKSFRSYTRVSWDNYVTVSNADARNMNCLMKLLLMVVNGSYATITTADGLLENVPVIVQPGQALGLLV
jgi:molybdopterin-containing oxidoreductase family iron-sulfur binding subunit